MLAGTLKFFESDFYWSFPKNKLFLPLDTHRYVCVSGCKKYSENFAFVLNGGSLT